MPVLAPALDRRTGAPPHGQGRAVVVEDHLFLRSVMAESLEALGYAVETASNGFSGLRLIRRAEPDLVVLDLLMPEQSGEDVLLDLRQDPRTAETPVLVVSGLARARSVIGPNEHLLQKPFTFDAFAQAVASVAGPAVSD